MPQRSLSADFGFGPGEAPPSYDTQFTPEEFEAKAVAVAEETRVNNGKQRAVEESGPSQGPTGSSGDYDEFEDWDDAKFAAAAAAYQLRQARMQQSASSHTPSSSTNRAQSPRVDAGTPVASSSRAASPRPADRSQPPKNSMHNPGQLPATQFDTVMQRNLPQQPTDAYRGGPLNSHNQQPNYIPQPTVAPQSDATSSQPWMSGASSDGHGRGSIDAPPPFASMDPSMEFPASPTSETHENGPVSQQQQAPSRVREDRYSTIPPPPPLNIPQAPASAPLQPTTSSLPPAFVPPHVMHRHSDVPLRTANTHNASLPARPRLSEVPSVSGRSSVASSARTPPPVFPGAHHPAFPGFVPPYDKKPVFVSQVSETTSRSQALYASANVRMNAPSVRLDLNKMAYSEHGQSQPIHGVKDETYAGSFYSHVASSFALYGLLTLVSRSSVSSVMKKRALPQPQLRRTTNESQYSAHEVSPPHAISYGAGPPMPTAFYGQSAQNHVNQGFYSHSHMQSPEVTTQSQYAPQQQQHYQQQQQPMHHGLPQGYPPVMQNHWTPAPDSWNHYGRP